MRGALSGALAAMIALGVAGISGGDPAARLTADRLVLERAHLADAALAELEAGVAAALEAARRGSARIVSGDEPPGPRMRAAGERLIESEPLAREARAALRAFDGARHARDPGVAGLGEPVQNGELASIGAQLEETAAAGDAFAEMRLRADEVAAGLDRALAALDAGDVSAARQAVEEARGAFSVVDAWEVDLVTLPVWLDTTDVMIGTMEMIVAATAGGDAERAAVSAQAFAGLADEAVIADRALRIAISEGGSAVAAAAMGRLAAVVAAVREARSKVATILQTVGR